MHKQTSNNQQAGLVSLLVTMIIMIILSLIVLGFAKNTRREQRQSLDRQLSSQASYAAETGINDIAAYIETQQAVGASINNFNKCGNTGGPSNNFVKSLPPDGNKVDANTSYSCALLNPEPTELIWQRINMSQSLAFPFNPPAANTEIAISWQDADVVASSYTGCASAGIPASGALVSQASWACQAGALRIDITPIGGGLSRTGLLNDTRNFVLYPVSNGVSATFNFTTIDHGNLIPVQCVATATPRHCKIRLTNATTDNYYIRIKPLYRAANIYVTGNTGNTLGGAQALVDVTGKAKDILKRLQVRLPINALESDDSSTIDYALQSIDSTCKLAAIVPGGSPPLINQDTSIPLDPSCP